MKMVTFCLFSHFRVIRMNRSYKLVGAFTDVHPYWAVATIFLPPLGGECHDQTASEMESGRACETWPD